MIILLFLLVFSPGQTRAGTAWKCPEISEESRGVEISCNCEIAHTLRCDGHIQPDSPDGPAHLRGLLKEVSSLPAENSVTLLDISVKNISRLQGKLFHNLHLQLSGLVISTGSLTTVDRKVFTGLEKVVNALGLPDNNLMTIPVTSLSGLHLLSRLDLSGNSVRKVTTLPTLTELEYLDLSRNRIRVMAGGWAQATPNLRTLLLAGNSLDMVRLSQGHLQHLTYLHHLDISHNNITGNLSLSSLAGVCPAGVKTLDMSFNGVTGIRALAFSPLTSLTSLNLAANNIDLIQDEAFSGLSSLRLLDLSHNSILTLGTASLAGMPSLTTLSLGHNFLQVVSASWLGHLANLTQLLLMDNDITSVEEAALDSLAQLTEINLAGNLLSCDCEVSYLYSYLHLQPSQLTNLSLHSAVCATPPPLTNAPLFQLSSSPECRSTSTTSNLATDYYYTYEYTEYTENSTVAASLLSSQEVHFQEAWYDSTTRHLHLTWILEEGGLDYTCGQLHVFEEREVEGVVNLSNEVAECDTSSTGQVKLAVSLASLSLQSDRPYIFCLSLQHGDQVVPGCSGAVTPDRAASQPEAEVRITALQGNVSTVSSSHNITLTVSTRLPANMMTSCSLAVSVSLPGQPPLKRDNYSCGLVATSSPARPVINTQLKAVLSSLPAHSYYNVCAHLSLDEVEADKQCMILHTSTIVRYQTRSVLSLLLTLIFLSLGIACLTVLYLILRHRAGHPGDRARARPRQHSCWGLAHSLSYWWRRATWATHNKNKLVEDLSDDEGI